MTVDEMVEWHHRLDGHEFEQASWQWTGKPGVLQSMGSVLFLAVSRLKVKLLSRVRLFATPWTVDYQASLSMEFSRQEYWSGLPFPSPECMERAYMNI